MEMPKNYDFLASEAKWQQSWNDQDIYKFDAKSGKEIFSIDTPPPTVSGKLHIGHVFSYTQTEIIARYQRMNGKEVLYPFGFDDNGLPTEILTERERRIKGADMPREEFVEQCEKVSAKYRTQFRALWESLGFSCAWENAYSTISEKSRRISQRSFLDLLQKDFVNYRQMPTLWCTQCSTSFAQAEIEDVQKGSVFNYLNFLTEGGEEVPIATTRPELLPGCVAMFVHPENEKYKHLIGQKAIVPMFGHTVTILADENADPEKGTGIVMCCTYGDVTDIDWWREHKLDMRVCFTHDGKMNERAGEFEGLTINEARAAITEKLKEEGLIFKQEDLAAEGRVVNTHERCGTPVEYLPVKQWFIKVCEHKDALIKQGEKVNWFPTHMGKRYRDWVDNLGWDWAISRQRYYGVPIPIWYAPDGTVIPASPEQLPVNPLTDKPLDCKGYDPETLIGEADVLDTWATSSISPELIAGWGEEDEMPQLRPMSIRPQAHDIIRTWAFYTIVKSYFHHNDIPWKDAVISGHVIKKEVKVEAQQVAGKDFARKSKISKSKDGDKFSPLKMIEKFGADRIRYWATSGTLGTDISFDEKEIDGSSRLLNKLWNSSKFAEGFFADYTHNEEAPELETIDRWVLAKFSKIIATYHKNFVKHEFFPARQALEHFFWADFCDNYIELVKHRLYDESEEGAEAAKAARWTLHTLLTGMLKMFAPFLPHITEEIWQSLFTDNNNSSIHLQQLPQLAANCYDEESEKAGELLLEAVTLVRTYKSKNNFSMKLAVDTLTIKTDEDNVYLLGLVAEDLCGVCKVNSIDFNAELSNPAEDSTERLTIQVEMDKKALARLDMVNQIKPVITALKQAAGLKGKSPVKTLLISCTEEQQAIFAEEPGQLKAAAKSSEVSFDASEGIELSDTPVDGFSLAIIIE